jgi:transcriptional regulator with XRE-family HTH domain
MKDGFLNKRINKLKEDPEFKAEALILDITEKISHILEIKKMRRSELAKKIHCSNAYISKLLNGEENLTIKTLSKIAQALDSNLLVSFGKTTNETRTDSSTNDYFDETDIQITNIPATSQGLGHYEFHPVRRKDMVKDEKSRKKRIGKGDLYNKFKGDKKKKKRT